jgi:uncharacterized phage-associated protein
VLAPFDIAKLVQVCGVLLQSEPNRQATRLRLLKLLYIADREMIQERGRSITGDTVVAMDHGPVLSKTYDLIKGTYSHPEWNGFINSGKLIVSLAIDPGIDRLTRKEVAKLQEVSERFSTADDYDLAHYTHEYAEWKKNRPDKGKAVKIPVEDVLEATGHSDDAQELIEAAQAEAQMHRLAMGG